MSPSRLDELDRRVDSLVAPWRGHPVADALAYAASAFGDHGLAWFLIGVVRGRRPGRRRAVALWAVLFTGVVTPAVNIAVKEATGRRRPEPRSDDPPAIRVPRSTSFPSGHALAAWCAATLLADGDPLAPLYYVTAGAVSVSRVHVRLHHASDVLAGAALGVGLGRLGRRLARPWLGRPG
ncbi:MAG TPA: phosphatase PAP2 family protein [Acidimicrobiales bacterium]|nr:phosphatase PAP2 family protein [Acidimicrobiales bacterium]